MKANDMFRRRSSRVCAVIALGHLTQLGCSSEVGGPSTDPQVNPFPEGSPSTLAPGSSVPSVATGPGGVAVPPGTEPMATPGGTGNPAGSASVPTPGVGTSVTPTAVPLPDEPSAGFVRRLTHKEFDTTVADLLGLEGQPSAGFASDVALQGFTNNAAGQNVTPTLAEQYIDAAEQLSRDATRNLPQLLGCEPGSVGEDVCISQFITDFGQRAWRRPLTTEEQQRASALFDTVRAQYELDVSVQLLVQYFILSPQFIYLVEPLPPGAAPGSIVPLDSWKVATRLSYFLLGSMPDEELYAQAAADALTTPEAVAAQARRLLALPQARERIGLFYTEWLRLRHLDKLQKDSTLFPDFDLSMGPMLREQVELFAQSVILDEGGTAADLLTAPFTFVNEKLAPLYDVEAPSGDSFVRVELDPNQRAGLLTHAALLATLAHQDQTDPVVRGKFIRESVLCDFVPPPPPGLVVTPPVITPGSTTRERFRQHQEEESCAGCHLLMDPIGLGFEHYDPLGQWRELDNGLDVDATGEIIGTDVAGTFDGAIELSRKLAESDQVMDCFTRTWFRFAMGRSEQPADAGALDVTGERFAASGFKMSELLVALAQTNAFRSQRVLDPNASALKDESMIAEQMEETP